MGRAAVGGACVCVHVGGWGGEWLRVCSLIDWQVFAYTVCNKMSRPALVVTCAGRRQNKLMRVIYHAARALLSCGERGRVGCGLVGWLPQPAIVSVASHLSLLGGGREKGRSGRWGAEERARARQLANVKLSPADNQARTVDTSC